MWNEIQLAIGYKHNAFVHKFMHLNSKSKFYNIFFDFTRKDDKLRYFLPHSFAYYEF